MDHNNCCAQVLYMKFDKYFPTDRLQPYIKYFVVSENELENEYKVFPSAGMVIGLQYKGHLSQLQSGNTRQLSAAGITGITDSYKIFRNSAGIGTVLVYFTEMGFTHFAKPPAHELFNLSLSLDYIFDKPAVREVQEKLAGCPTDRARVAMVERFLLGHLKNIESDRLVTEAVKIMYQTGGTLKIGDLSKRLFTSQSPLEKRFKKLVGTTPKKFASIIRFNTVLNNLNATKTLTELSYEHQFFDQAHFIRDFKQFTGDTPEQFKRFL